MVVLVTGAHGQLGQSVQFIAKNHPEIAFVFCSSATLDITQKENCQAVFSQIKPDYCINAAAYTAVDKAESEPEKAYQVNAIGAKNLAEVCREFATVLLHVSTDFVFDGNKETPYTEEDFPNPTGVYGQTKLDGEHFIQQIMDHYFIIRTSWVYSQFGNNFMKTMLRLAKERTSLSVVNDQTGTPTNVVDLAEVLVTIILSGKKAYGIYHFSNEGECTWFDFAKAIFESNGIEMDLQPISTAEFPTAAKRPKYSVLDKTKIKTAFEISIESWQDALKK